MELEKPLIYLVMDSHVKWPGRELVKALFLFFFRRSEEMADCNFKCIHDERGECREGGGECIRDCCPDWMDCDSCERAEDCEV